MLSLDDLDLDTIPDAADNGSETNTSPATPRRSRALIAGVLAATVACTALAGALLVPPPATVALPEPTTATEPTEATEPDAESAEIVVAPRPETQALPSIGLGAAAAVPEPEAEIVETESYDDEYTGESSSGSSSGSSGGSSSSSSTPSQPLSSDAYATSIIQGLVGSGVPVYFDDGECGRLAWHGWTWYDETVHLCEGGDWYHDYGVSLATHEAAHILNWRANPEIHAAGRADECTTDLIAAGIYGAGYTGRYCYSGTAEEHARADKALRLAGY